ncbi:MAG: hypothetical protein ACRDYF_01345 [Acidimicrobiia bacterium]
MRKETVMAVTGVPQAPEVPEILDSDDFDEPGTVGLHLGLLRRLARMALAERPASDSPASEG